MLSSIEQLSLSEIKGFIGAPGSFTFTSINTAFA